MKATQTKTASPGETRHRATRIVGLVLLACWVSILVGILLSGHRTSTFSQLKADVAAGRVTEVQVNGLMADRAVGYAVMEVSWREGLFGYTTSVIEERPRGQAPQGAVGGATAVVDGSVAWALREINPDVRITGTERRGGFSIYGWTTPGWAGLSGFAVLLATIGLITTGPQPRHATRWGWFWLVFLTAPLGAIAYLLLSGVTAAKPPPGPAPSRLTGGWALLLGIAVGSAMGALVGAVIT